MSYRLSFSFVRLPVCLSICLAARTFSSYICQTIAPTAMLSSVKVDISTKAIDCDNDGPPSGYPLPPEKVPHKATLFMRLCLKQTKSKKLAIALLVCLFGFTKIFISYYELLSALVTQVTPFCPSVCTNIFSNGLLSSGLRLRK